MDNIEVVLCRFNKKFTFKQDGDIFWVSPNLNDVKFFLKEELLEARIDELEDFINSDTESPISEKDETYLYNRLTKLKKQICGCTEGSVCSCCSMPQLQAERDK